MNTLLPWLHEWQAPIAFAIANLLAVAVIMRLAWKNGYHAAMDDVENLLCSKQRKSVRL